LRMSDFGIGLGGRSGGGRGERGEFVTVVEVPGEVCRTQHLSGAKPAAPNYQ